jgi:hypothetical protein
MADRVVKICPGCRKDVRVPAAWADRAVKCKACGTTIRGDIAKPIPVATAVPVATAGPTAEPIPVVVIPEEPIESSELIVTEPVIVRSPYRAARKSNQGAWAVAALVGLAVVTGGVLYGTGVFGKGTPSKPTEVAGKGEGSGKNSTLANASTPYPRRLLFISISRYAYLNPLTAAAGARGDSATDAARKLAYEWRVPTDSGNNQFFLLSDSGKDARPAVKAVVQPTYERFFATSRAQDHVVVYFSGHAVEKEGKAYLVPSDGDADDMASLIPLDEFYAKLKACPAQQKVVIFDVCRFNPQFGRQRPGSEPMPEALAKALHAPPPGVQVWTTCSAGENAVELPKTGSEFLAAFRIVADKGKLPAKSGLPEEPIPVHAWAEAVRAKVAELVTKDGKPAQTPTLTGTEPKDAVAFNPEEPPAARFDLPALPKGADSRLVAAVFRDLDLPGIRDDKAADAPSFESAFYFADGVLKDYAEKDVPFTEMEKDKEKYAVRLAALDALKTIRDTWTRTKGDGSGRLRETFAGEADDKTKKLIEDEQTVPARIELELSKLLRRLETAEKSLDQEPSKRWRATFQYAYAQALARWAYINEYDLMLGAIRKDDLPKIDKAKGDAGWQIVSVPVMKSKKDVPAKADAAKELFGKVAAEYKGTPWAMLAKQHQNIAVGLEWRAYNPSEGTVKDGP